MKKKLKKGLTLNISGNVSDGAKPRDIECKSFAVFPDDFPGFTPKVTVKENDTVASGTPLMQDKNTGAKLVSPVDGTVKAIVRGERRKVICVTVESSSAPADKSVSYSKPADRAQAQEFLSQSGLLAFIRQRPFDIVPDPRGEVRDIFVTAIDNAPLAVGYGVCDSLFAKEDYEEGIKLLSLLTDGKIYISHTSGFAYFGLKGADFVEVEGGFPAGNAGVQAANIAPVNKGENIWCLDFATLGRIGRTLNTGKPDFRTVVAVTGAEIKVPELVKTHCGASLQALIGGNLKNDAHHVRIISGNVLVGTVQSADGYLRYPYRQVTIIPEGDDRAEFMGWASLSPSKMSQNNSFFGSLFGRKFNPDARLNGGRRAMIMSCEYDKYIPMDILPEYLIKAILAKNIDDMEKLGIYEVAPEDFAAAEYADISKLPLQQIVRTGLDYLRKEME